MDQSVSSSAVERLIDVIGMDVVRYVLGLDAPSAGAPLPTWSVDDLSEAQRAVLQLLLQIEAQIAEVGDRTDGWFEGVWSVRLMVGSGYKDGLEDSVANRLRTAALVGSGMQVEHAASTLEELFEGFARSSYPAYLLPTDGPFSPAGVSLFLARHRYREKVAERFLADPVFGGVFTRVDDVGPRSLPLWSSTGHGSDLQLEVLPGQILHTAWRHAVMTRVTPSLAEFVAATRAVLEQARTVLSGRELMLPTKVGVTGVVLAVDVDAIDVGIATIRRADRRDQEVVRRINPDGALGTFDQVGERVTINFSGDLVIEVHVPFKMMPVEKFWEKFVPPSGFPDTRSETEEIVDRIRLALLLAHPEQAPILHWVWTVQSEPIHHGGGLSWARNVGAHLPVHAVSISLAEAAEWKVWATALDAHFIPELNVAVRRLLSSVAEPRSSEDMLVDAVMVWENLFGGTVDTSFRITTCLAKLLGDGIDDQMRRLKEYKAIYTLRSKVVHGTANLDATRVRESGQAAIRIAIEAIRALLTDHSELLKIRSSAQRGQEFLLT